ncbi:ATP-binding cassette domain-containing protein [Bowmanella dokdonensis]|uniref:ATP-binding cassette domain-containing protein n=1 Tax=Bowmanella dokdonensis TaxID=751969 RepID=A0A939DLQ8_9ALTE|nr:ATP-binding cassette domain-containing protein [Bowmanella dokdonensis]MBN7824798.1 ATP-binding cassette domain-containing protein [Bowmanella dokdonensis]
MPDNDKSLKGWMNEQGAACGGALLLLPALALLAIITQISLYWHLSLAVDGLIVHQQIARPETWYWLCICACAWLALDRVRHWLTHRSHHKLCGQMQNALHRQLLLGQLALVRQHSRFYWQQLWLNEIPSVADYLSRYKVQQAVAVLAPVLVLFWLSGVSWLVALLILICLPVVPLFMYLVGTGAATLQRRHFIALERLGNLFTDRLQAADLMLIHRAYDAQHTLLDSASQELNKRTMKVVSLAFLSTTVLDFFSTLSVALVAVFVGFNLLGEVQWGPPLSLQQGFFILLVVPLCFTELKTLGRLYHKKNAALSAASELKPVLAPSLSPRPGGPFQGLEWHNLTTSTPNLKASHLVLQPKDWVLLQGPSGSGKSVLLECLMGQRSCSHQVKGEIALLTQQAVITPDTLRQNLCQGNQYPDQQLWEVLQSVELDSWARHLAEGLDTLMGKHPPLSGGQAQRLALARILLSQAQLVLLDEPTAHLTDQQHQRLAKVIRTQLSGRTLIWASHKALPETWFNRHWHVNQLEVTQR